MSGGLRIWLREQAAKFRAKRREFARRRLRGIVEIIVTDLDLMARLRDVVSSTLFEEKYLRDAASFKHRLALHRAVLAQIAHPDGLHLEFGVYKGDSLNRFAAARPEVTWHGFDSFVGLPEAWTLGAKTGAFSLGGKLPPVRGNVRLVAGFFEDTLPDFTARHRGAKIALLHIDCDLYSATKTVLEGLAVMLAPGSIILFDELINYHGWEEGEYKAFMEFAAKRKMVFEYIAYNRTGSEVAVRVIDPGAAARKRERSAAVLRH